MSRHPSGGRRRLDTTVPPDYEMPTRAPRITSRPLVHSLIGLTFLVWILAAVAAGTSVVAVGAPIWIERPAAATLMVIFSLALTHRAGGRMRLWIPIVGVLGISAVVLETNVLLAAAAAMTAVLASVTAVTNSRPASTVAGAIAEYVFALLASLVGTVGVAAWNAPVNYQRFNLVVISASLMLAIAMVWNLGAGLHGLGRQGLMIPVGFALLLVVVLAYSSFVRTHGSQTVVDGIGEAVIWLRQNIGGVPRPVEVFIGFPALIVGVSIRSRHREGWWVLVFAVIGTAVVTTSLVTPSALPTYIGLSTLYSSILGLVVGLIARHFVMRERSSRSARAIEPVVRVEPPRTAPLK
ncbi:MAG: hypothetical protein ABIR57_03890 [Aeromicrobium sp.]